MPSISTKGLQMPESPIRKLVPFAEIAKKNGTKVYHLNIGQPDIKTPQVALDAVKNNDIEAVSSLVRGLPYTHEKCLGKRPFFNKNYRLNQLSFIDLIKSI